MHLIILFVGFISINVLQLCCYLSSHKGAEHRNVIHILMIVPGLSWQLSLSCS
jgi:hypothetical protein